MHRRTLCGIEELLQVRNGTQYAPRQRIKVTRTHDPTLQQPAHAFQVLITNGEAVIENAWVIWGINQEEVFRRGAGHLSDKPTRLWSCVHTSDGTVAMRCSNGMSSDRAHGTTGDVMIQNTKDGKHVKWGQESHVRGAK